MAEKRKLEFFLLRYVPDAVKGEFVNIGIVMFERAADGGGFADVRFTNEWKRVRCLDPQADIVFLSRLEADLRTQLTQTQDRESLIRKIEDSFSNVIQLSGLKGCLSDNPAQELQLLTQLYLKPRVAIPETESEVVPLPDTGDQHGAGRQHILRVMENAFRRAGIWKLLMRSVPASSYGHPGDPFKFDFGYRIRDGKEIKLFHAVSMTSSIDAAVLLASRYQRIGSVMAQRTSSTPILTAVVEAGLDPGRHEVLFALEMMEESRIRVAETTEMPGIAELARVELGA